MTELQASVAGVDSAARVRVWDRFVRVFHWGLVAAFATAWASSDDAEALHQWAGYSAAALIVARIVWGFIGSHYARFAQWVPTPRTLRAYLQAMLRGREPYHPGHNPAAAVMILFLMTMVLAIATSGWLMTTDAFWGSELMEEFHEGCVNVTLGAVALHIAAAVYESLRHRENLIRAMFTGYKRSR
ncbi:cytochrome b/b6 domain-containing protein [Plasticicumulans acidivorans]|uniref:Cytochrome b n=1 Tax=Plasticicumulans acidivorans TaxID=886464 RepID=A0A317MTX4_9GAMM|nr:cytochrome b/b6 domain-containing protein [Plasticicumulans acidivorans]PWV60555.1 cytochrome b [Plasticicumulans acidivorans]